MPNRALTVITSPSPQEPPFLNRYRDLSCIPIFYFSEGYQAGTRVFISVGIHLKKFSDAFLTRVVRINAVISTPSCRVRARISSSAQRTVYGDIESVSRLKIIDLIDENSLMKSPDLGTYTSAPSRRAWSIRGSLPLPE